MFTDIIGTYRIEINNILPGRSDDKVPGAEALSGYQLSCNIQTRNQQETISFEISIKKTITIEQITTNIFVIILQHTSYLDFGIYKIF